jgi:hypothetical protein
MTTVTAVAGILFIVGFVMAIVVNYMMWWGADSMIAASGGVGIIGLLMAAVAGSVKLNSSRLG